MPSAPDGDDTPEDAPDPPEVIQEQAVGGQTETTLQDTVSSGENPGARPQREKKATRSKRGKKGQDQKDVLADIERRSVEKIQRLGTDKLLPLICKIAIPNIVGMTTTAVYNNADSAFVGQYLDQDGLTANGLFAPMENLLVTGVVVAFSNGASSLISPAFGRRDFQATNYYITVFTVLCYTWAVLLPVCTLPWLDSFLRLLGASTPAVLEYSRQYALIVLTAGTIAVSFSLGTGALIRSENRSVLSMGRQILGAVINVALDALLFATLSAQLGYYCASVSTAVSQLVVGLWMILNLTGVCKGGVLRINYRLLGRGKEVFARGYDILGVKGAKSKKGKARGRVSGRPTTEPRIRHVDQGRSTGSTRSGQGAQAGENESVDDRPVLDLGPAGTGAPQGSKPGEQPGAIPDSGAVVRPDNPSEGSQTFIEMHELGMESSGGQTSAFETSVSVLDGRSIADPGARCATDEPATRITRQRKSATPGGRAVRDTRNVNKPESNAGAFFHIVGQVLAQGLPSYINSVPAFLGVLTGNINLSRYGGEKADKYRAALALFSRVQMFITLPSRGFYLTFQSILGYQLGAKLYTRTYHLLVLSIIVDLIIVVVLWALAEGLAYQIMQIFVKADNEELRELGTFALRLGIAAYPMVPLVELSSGLAQYERRAVLASSLQLSRMVITIAAQFVLPLIVPGTPAFGVYYAFPFGDFLGGLFGLIVYTLGCLRYKKLSRELGDGK